MRNNCTGTSKKPIVSWLSITLCPECKKELFIDHEALYKNELPILKGACGYNYRVNWVDIIWRRFPIQVAKLTLGEE